MKESSEHAGVRTMQGAVGWKSLIKIRLIYILRRNLRDHSTHTTVPTETQPPEPTAKYATSISVSQVTLHGVYLTHLGVGAVVQGLKIMGWTLEGCKFELSQLFP